MQFGASIKMQMVGSYFSAVPVQELSLRHPKTDGPSRIPVQNSLSSKQTAQTRTGERTDSFLRAAAAQQRRSRCRTDLTVEVTAAMGKTGRGLSIKPRGHSVLEEVFLRDRCWEKPPPEARGGKDEPPHL